MIILEVIKQIAIALVVGALVAVPLTIICCVGVWIYIQWRDAHPYPEEKDHEIN